MEQSPISGYLKAFTFALLTLVVFLAFWQKNKVEDKITALDRSVAEMGDKIDQLTVELRQGGGFVHSGGNPTAADWGWPLNEQLDQDLDPSRPLGTPGRYANVLRLDPAGPEAPGEAPDLDDTIHLPWGSEPKGFNFLVENYAELSDECELYVMDYPAHRHWKEPSSFNWKPRLCWRVEASPDYKEYTLYFRQDAYWQEPQADLRQYPHLKGRHPVTAHDLKFTLDTIMNEQSNCAVSRSYYEKFDSVEVLDDYTAVMRWKETVFVSLSYTLNATILPRFIYGYDELGQAYPAETVASEFNDHWYDRLRLGPVGCGPYRFTKYEPGQYVRMERWDDWYGFRDEPRYPIKVRHLRIYNEGETQMNWLRKGDLDIGGLTAPRYRSWLQEETDPQSPFKNGDITVYLARRASYFYIGWKNSDPMFTDKRVRQALTYACDRFHICEKVFLGRWEPMAAPIYPYSSEADPDLQPYPFDLEKAKRLLDEAGWAINPETGLREKTIDGQVKRLEFKLYFPSGNSEYVDMLNHYKNDLLKVGIRMTPQSVQWAQFQKGLTDREYVAFSLGWATNGWEHDFGQIWHSRGIQDPGSSNYIEFSNPEVDRLSDELRTIMDPEKRIAAIRRIGRILYEEQPYTFFAWGHSFRGYWKQVHNVEEKPYFFRPFLRSFPLWIDR